MAINALFLDRYWSYGIFGKQRRHFNIVFVRKNPENSYTCSMPSLRVFGSGVWNLFDHDNGRHRVRQIQRHRQGIQRRQDHPWKGDHLLRLQ